MASRHGQLAQALVDHLENNWVDKPANTSIVRSHSYNHLVKNLTGTESAFIAVIVPNTQSAIGDRGTDIDDVPVFVCVVANLADIEVATVDVWDEHAESCRDSIRNRSLSSITLSGGSVAKRQGSINLTTTYDADFLDQESFLFAVMDMRYLIDVDVT